MSGWLVAVLLAVAAAAGAGLATAGLWRRHRRAERALRTELTHRLDELFTLHELTYLLAGSLEPARIARHLADYLERFFSARGALVALLRGEGDATLEIAAASGTLADLTGKRLAESEAGVLAAAMGAEHLELIERDEGEPSGQVLLAGRPVERAAVLPLRAHGVSAGAIAIVDAPRPFPAEELRLFSTVATHAAAVISNGLFFELVQEARDDWESTFDALAAGLCLVDDRGRIRRANRALGELTGRPPEALAGADLRKAVFGDAVDLEVPLTVARTSGGPESVTGRSSCLDRLLRVTAARRHGRGASAWVVVMIEDVTEQKLLEAQIIQNEKLAAVGQLVSGVAHELNNPLTSIAGLAEVLLARTALAGPDREHLEVMREQAERAGRIVRNLLTFARKGPAEVTEFSLNDIVRRTVALVSHEVRLREVTLETALDPDLPELRGDRYQIQQVVVNLVTNGLQAVAENPPGRPRAIRITTAQAGREAVLRVADTGPGIREGDAPRIFTPFFTTKPEGQGTGLGLAISFRIAQGHGGRLSVHAGEDGGSTFELRLPLTDEAAPQAPRPRPTPAPAGRQILLLDADPAVRTAIAVLLGGDAHTVEAVPEGPAARTLLAERRFDLVIADPRAAMPGGERFGEQLLRERPDLRARTIFITADVRPETEQWLRDLGCRYVFKPFRAGELKEAAAEVLAAATG